MDRLANFIARMLALSISAPPSCVGAIGVAHAESYIPLEMRVVFEHRGATLSESARREIEQYTPAFCRYTGACLAVDGYSDPDEVVAERDRDRLGWQRAQAVANALIERGFDRAFLIVRPSNADGLNFSGARGVPEHLNRVVVVRWMPVRIPPVSVDARAPSVCR